MTNDTGNPSLTERSESTERADGDLRLAFIVGCRRSGTTWTMMLTVQHPEVVALQQTDVMRRLFHFTTWFSGGHPYGRCALMRDETPGHDEPKRTQLVDVLDQQRLYDLARPLSDEIFRRAASLNPQAGVVVEQTPEHIDAAAQILRVYPDAHFIHVVRDPRAVFASHRGAAKGWAKPRFFSTNPVDVSSEWLREVARGQAIEELTPNFLQVRYESLKQDGQGELARLHRFLGLESTSDEREAALAACSIDRLRGQGHAPTGFFRRGEAEAWRRELSSSELRTIEILCGPVMEEFGYRRTQQAPVAVPMQVRLRRLRERTKRRLRRTAQEGNGLSRRALSGAARLSPSLRRILADS